MRTVIAIVVATLTAAAAPLAAQQQHSSPAPTAVSPAQAAQPPADNFTYQADGRRDPFVNLLGTGPEPRLPARRPDGAAGLALGEISVRGVMQSRGALVAMILGPDNKTYVVHEGDKLLDATIKSITPEGLVAVQRVTDPLSNVKQREVRKLLRSLEDAK
jgi:Tfp pilus assembly protein PilP